MNMKKLLFALILLVTSVSAFGQISLTAVSLLRPGSNSTILTTNGTGSVVWGNASTILTAGTGITISGNQITNSAPNQTVALTGAGIAAVTGTYPNFTVTATEVDGSITNEAQTLSAAGTTSPTLTLTAAGGAGGGTITFAAGAGISLAQSSGTITIANTASGSLSFFKQVMVSAGTTVTVSGFTPTTTNCLVILDGTVMEWGAGNDVTVSGSILTFSRTLEVSQKVLVIKIH
jgi:hypothetical protein